MDEFQKGVVEGCVEQEGVGVDFEDSFVDVLVRGSGVGEEKGAVLELSVVVWFFAEDAGHVFEEVGLAVDVVVLELWVDYTVVGWRVDGGGLAGGALGRGFLLGGG